MLIPPTVLIAYPSQPAAIGTAIKGAATLAGSAARTFETWAQLDIFGRFLIDGILQKIDVAEFVVADITRLNANVAFWIAYAIGKQSRHPASPHTPERVHDAPI